MGTILTQLLERRTQLEAEAAPLREQLVRCDEVIAAADEAQQHRDRLLTQHDWTTAAAITSGRYPPPIDPELDAAEIALRRAQSSARGALLAQAQVVEQLAEINAKISTLTADLEEATWAVVPAAAGYLFREAEEAMIAFERALARLDSVAVHALTMAHQSANGRALEATAAHRCHVRMGAMVAKLSATLGTHAVRDFETGAKVLASVVDGSFRDRDPDEVDISRWEPASQAARDGTANFNRGEPLGAPVAGRMPNPDVEMAAHAAAPSPVGALEAPP